MSANDEPYLKEFRLYKDFEKNNPKLTFRSESIFISKEHYFSEEKKKKYDFIKKFNDFKSSGFIPPFYLEKELSKQIKYWHSTNEEFNLPVLTLDNFFNAENVKSHLLKDKFIKKNSFVITYYIIDFVISTLEKKTFDKILIDGITSYQEEQYQKGIIGPLIDRDVIYYLVKDDIEEKLNILYKENSLGYSYITEKIITFDLFIIYLILKNYPFYILRRERLEEIFSQVKKFKNFPYPIGSIGMDLFKLLINELYLPGISLFQEIRETFLLDIIDPNILEIDCNYFIKTIAFSRKKSLYGTEGRSRNKENESMKKSKDEKFKLSNLKNFSFSAFGVYSAYILYSADDKNEEKENSYLGDILALFEKKFVSKKKEFIERESNKKTNKDNNDEDNSKNNIDNDNKSDKDNQENISEKNIINSIINLIDIGLDSNFAIFSRGLKTINEKLISKTKEMHQIKTNPPHDNINLRRFLNHKIDFLDFELSEKIKKNIFKKTIINEEISTKSSQKKLKNYVNDDIDTSNKNNKNEIINEENDDYDDEEKNITLLKEKKDCINEIKKYKKILDDEKKLILNDKDNVENNDILENYVENFLNLKNKYFWHMQKFDLSLKFESEEEKKGAEKMNRITEKRKKLLPELYKQKYIIKEDQLLDFVKLLYKCKTNIIPLYHTKIYEEFAKKEQKKLKSNYSNKNNLYKNFDIFEGDDEFPETDKDFASISLSTFSKIKEGLEQIAKTKLYFNSKIYLIPGPINTSLTSHLSRNDFIYKSTIGDAFLYFYKEKIQSVEIEDLIEMPVQIYLREAKHYFDLTIFKTIIKTSNNYNDDENFKKIHLYKNYFLLYGGVHIEVDEDIELILDGKRLNFKNRMSKLYVDIIHLYNFENEDKNKKINDIEKYLVYSSNNDKFQIFISGTKDDPNINNIERENNHNQYFQNYIGNLINFDVKSAYYEAKKIIIQSNNFIIRPTFIEGINIENCSYFEIAFNYNNDTEEENNNEENEEEENDEKNNDINDVEIISKFFQSDKTTSFNLKISSFIDLESDNK